MTFKPKPPMMTHQQGLPADSASCEKPGGSPKPSSQSLHDSLVQCDVNDGLYPVKGDLVWVWLLFTEHWQVYTVVDQRMHRFGGPKYNILNSETGETRWVRYSKLYIPRE